MSLAAMLLRPPRRRHALGVLAVVLLSALAATPASQTLFGSFDKVQFDLAGALFPAGSSRKVVVVSVDAKTVHELGVERIFQRQTHAGLIDRLAGASSITFDELFPVPGPDGFPFAQAIQRNGRVVLPIPSDKTGAGGELLMPTSAELCTAVAGVGHHEITIGPYGAVTGIVPYRLIGRQIYRHVALEAIRVAQASISDGDLRCRVFPQALSVGHRTTGSLMLLLSGIAPIQRYAYVDVLMGRVPPAAFSGKLVFVGHSVYDTGAFKLSSLNPDTVPRAELDAAIAESLLDGNVIGALPAWCFMGVYAALAAAMLSICARTPGRRMHWFALAWGVGVLLLSTALLGAFRIWAPAGALLACGLLIYGVFASSRLDGTLRLLRAEIGELRRISSAVVFQDEAAPAPAATDTVLGVRNDIQAAMHQIRSWQAAYVNVINLLPYPIFLEQDGRIVLCNDKASRLLERNALFRRGRGEGGGGGADAQAAPITIAAVQQFAAQHRSEAVEGGVEIELNGASHMLLCVSFEQDAERGKVSTLICLVDISGVKEAVTHDRQVLRHMAHDIRNPLTTIVAMLEGERVKEMEVGNERVEKFVGELRRLVDYSLGVAQDFLQLARAERLNVEDFAPVPLADLVYETVDNLAAFAEQQSIELTSAGLDGEEVFVLANRDMLMRSLVNIVDNAIKYSPPRTTIRVTLVRAGVAAGHAVVAVSDEGRGIPEEALPHLFEPFFQVGGGSPARSGVGLGLPFVQTVIERHGGTVDVVSRVGHGSTFRLTLPVTPVELG
jgi:CHASE2 domain-containing sensor protein/nitrogen-specific signal transduction histidine kinase